ncbi:MAG: exo-beta-N-acetylmuramidase NamZ domain-containing protein, partial [Bacteroidales bacterium]
MKRILIFAASVLALCACCRSQAQTCAKAPVVKPGVEVLRDRGFAGLEGKKVGLLTNPSGVDRNLQSTIDILYKAKNVDLVRLFAPEHGVRGDIYAGGHAEDTFDEATGLKVYSIYGKYRKPTPEMLKGLDVVVYDIQDVGARSYTFISALGLMMRACAENGVEVMVLDRPNPLGGEKVEGCVVEPGFFSYIGE